jgi:hypothetical protein
MNADEPSENESIHEADSNVTRRGFLGRSGLSAVGAVGIGAASSRGAEPATSVTPLQPNEEMPFRFQKGVRTIWNNFKKPHGGGITQIQPGKRLSFLDIDGPGIVDRLWLTLDWPGKKPYKNSMLRNRSVIIECFWDGSDKPAVSAPIGDFFGHILGYDIPFESDLFGDPCGRSSLCWAPMPFRKHARIDIINDYDKPIMMCPDFRVRLGVKLDENDSYFHAFWNRTPAVPKEGHVVLPEIRGRGRYLGTHIGIISSPRLSYQWHFGSLAWFLDADDEKTTTFRTTTLDDYGGSSWDYDLPYMHREAGLLFSRYFKEGGGHHGLYVHHLRDLIQFEKRAKVVQHRTGAVNLQNLIDAIERDPTIAEETVILPKPLAELKAEAKKNRDLALPIHDDLTTCSFIYLDTPNGIAESCLAKAERKTPGHQWPLEVQQ